MNTGSQSLVDSLADHIASSGWIRFREMNEYLFIRGVVIQDGDEELTGEHVRQAHVWPDTVLLGPTSEQYVEIVEALFSSYPIALMIGDMADFGGDEPWWVAWVGPPPGEGILGRAYPPVNPYIHVVADEAKHAFAVGSQIIAETQYRLAELAGTGRLDPDESFDLQKDLVDVYEVLYAGTLCAVRDSTTPDDTWNEADNTYSDGRQVINQIRVEPHEESDYCWEHNRFMLGDGAPNEFPMGTISYIAPTEPERFSDKSDDQTTDLADRLMRHRQGES